jgi:hypothetical protein
VVDVVLDQLPTRPFWGLPLVEFRGLIEVLALCLEDFAARPTLRLISDIHTIINAASHARKCERATPFRESAECLLQNDLWIVTASLRFFTR